MVEVQCTPGESVIQAPLHLGSGDAETGCDRVERGIHVEGERGFDGVAERVRELLQALFSCGRGQVGDDAEHGLSSGVGDLCAAWGHHVFAVVLVLDLRELAGVLNCDG
ncbi:hypothetical protein [Microbacterium sp. 77mftsu3.1]|uniref:hypothetical protein n=1 Tax=Microbacterium sp. 77mftsu3.1 TaxID=1761802 RepID=UPI0015A4852C|nr:hypothetical protein [Microbacterium sp. 77mftsu3.1]